MTQFLSGQDLADFIKVRQLKQVRGLKQSYGVYPKLVIFVNTKSKVIDIYVKLKQLYGSDIGVDVEVRRITGSFEDMVEELEKANRDAKVHGIIVQLPISDPSKTENIVSLIDAKKDVDGLNENSSFDSATAVAINWLLSAYNVDLRSKKITILGAGRLVGAPLYKMWTKSGLGVSIFDKESEYTTQDIAQSDIIVSGVGKPNIVTKGMVKPGAIIIDAGTASEGGVIRGDVSEEVRRIDTVQITPEKGGVGPLTVSALFDNVIQATIGSQESL